MRHIKVKNKFQFLSIAFVLLFLSTLNLINNHLNVLAQAQNKTAPKHFFRKFPFAVYSTAFAQGKKIPTRYTAGGADISPPLRWENVPDSTMSYAIIVEDPDSPSGTWTHWIIYDIPGTKIHLKEGIKPQTKLADGSIQAMNSFHKIGYGGPSPPPGSSHRYFFKIYALDCLSNAIPSFCPPEKDMQKFKSYLNQHAKAQAELMGIYERR